MRIWVEIDRGWYKGHKETRAVSGTQDECEEMIALWKREYGEDKVKITMEEK